MRRMSSRPPERSRRKRSTRSVRSTASPPRPRSTRTAATSAASRACPLSPAAQHHAGEPRRQGQVAQAAAHLGDAPLAVERAELPQQRPRLLQGRSRRRIEEGERRRIGDAPGGAVEQEGREIGGQDFRAGRRARARRSRPPPRGGSRRQAPCGPRGRGADRRRRARRARSPAASGRYPARRPARGRDPNR